MDVNTTQVLTPRATNRNAFIFDLAPPCSYTMKLGTQHVFDCLISELEVKANLLLLSWPTTHIGCLLVLLLMLKVLMLQHICIIHVHVQSLRNL